MAHTFRCKNTPDLFCFDVLFIYHKCAFNCSHLYRNNTFARQKNITRAAFVHNIWALWFSTHEVFSLMNTSQVFCSQSFLCTLMIHHFNTCMGIKKTWFSASLSCQHVCFCVGVNRCLHSEAYVLFCLFYLLSIWLFLIMCAYSPHLRTFACVPWPLW